MKQITSVEWLIEMIGTDRLSNISNIEDTINEAKQLHKNEIMGAFNESRLTHPMIGFKHRTFEEYYNETFKSE
jgi:hypothetical protein